MSDIKLQLACFLLTTYIFIRYTRLSKIYPTTQHSFIFKWLLTVSFLETIFDAATAYTVNDPSLPSFLNDALHWFFFILIDTEMYFVYLYFLTMLPGLEKRTYNISIVGVVYILNMLIVSISMTNIVYIEGEVTNYSYGAPVYACFLMASLYVSLLFIQLLLNWRDVSGVHKANAITIFVVLTLVSLIQYLFPEALVTGLVSVFVSVAVYVNKEDPLRHKYFLENEKMHAELEKATSLLETLQEDQIEEDDYVSVFDTARNRMIKVKHSEIICLESVANYVNLYAIYKNKVKLIQLRQTLASIAEQLAYNDKIIQVHRSYVVNIDYVVKVDNNARKCILYLYKLNIAIPVSRNAALVSDLTRIPPTLPLSQLDSVVSLKNVISDISNSDEAR